MKTHGLPFRTLMAIMAAIMRTGATREAAYAQAGGYKSQGKGRAPSWPASNNSMRTRRAAEKRRNQLRHKAACR